MPKRRMPEIMRESRSLTSRDVQPSVFIDQIRHRTIDASPTHHQLRQLAGNERNLVCMRLATVHASGGEVR